MKEAKIFGRKIPFTYETFFNQYRTISTNMDEHVLLESGRGGRFSIAGFNPEVKLEGKNYQLKVTQKNGDQVLKGNPLHLLKDWMSTYKVEKRLDLPFFQGGAIGFISYDYAGYIEKLPNVAIDDMLLPDICFFIFKEWFVFDHTKDELWILFLYDDDENSNLEKRADYWEERWKKGKTKENTLIAEVNEARLEVSMNQLEFEEAVKKIQHYISQGDVFQVNLSVRQSQTIQVSAMAVYEQLRKLNPSPYMGYFHTKDFQLVSGSPELLVKKQGSEVSTRPIAGTRSRGKNNEEDLELVKELIENEKERAEHVMLVDLERNDLGRVCKYGTVNVNEFMVIEKYSHVMHIVSNVKGELDKGKNAFDVIDAVFPGGTITGAPKVRTMEIIEELEPVKRGVYTGSLGWIDFTGDMELNIIIRTMLVRDGKAHVQAGAGIVIDSNPKHEYKESLKKAMALWKAKSIAENSR